MAKSPRTSLRRLFYLVALVLACACSSSLSSLTLQSSPSRALVSGELSATIAVVENFDGIYRPFCAGVWVSEFRAVTAHHCVAEFAMGERVDVAYHSDVDWANPSGEAILEAHKAVVTRLDPSHDLAVLTVPYVSHYHRWADLAVGDIKAGDSLHIVGHPAGFMFSWLPGYVAATRTMTTPRGMLVRVLHVTSAAYRGNSGGGAFDSSGALVGICAFIGGSPEASFFIHRDHVRDLIADQ